MIELIVLLITELVLLLTVRRLGGDELHALMVSIAADIESGAIAGVIGVEEAVSIA